MERLEEEAKLAPEDQGREETSARVKEAAQKREEGLTFKVFSVSSLLTSSPRPSKSL
jgi:hypothetical protein